MAPPGRRRWCRLAGECVNDVESSSHAVWGPDRKQLEAWEHPTMRAVKAQHGAGENQFTSPFFRSRMSRKVSRIYSTACICLRVASSDSAVN